MCRHCASLRQLYLRCEGFDTVKDGTLVMLIGGKRMGIAYVRCFDKPQDEGWTMFYPTKIDGLYTVVEEDARKQPPPFFRESPAE